MFPTEDFQAGRMEWKTWVYFGEEEQRGGLVWTKPNNISIVFILTIGAGGGGGGGHSGASGSNRGGGGGGGAGGWTRGIYPAYALPPELYLFPGYNKGLGPGNAGQGGAGQGDSYVGNARNFSGIVHIIQYGIGGTGGGAGTGAGAGAGGASAIATVASNMPSGVCGIQSMSAGGVAGTQGGAFGAGTALTPSSANNHFCSGGTGGGGCTNANAASAGGAINAYGPHIQLAGGAANGGMGRGGWDLLTGVPTGGVSINNNMTNAMPMIWGTGGTGGGGNNGVAGNGGPGGGPGCGGGGGGGGTTGGKGGDSYGAIIISCA